MLRSGLCLLLLVAAATGAALKLKHLFDPGRTEFPLKSYSWEEWKELDQETKLRAKGTDPTGWTTPPPEPETEEEKKRREEREAQRKKQGVPEHPGHIVPGFRFDDRLELKRKAFEQLVQPASASKLEGLIKQLGLMDKALQKFDRSTREVREEYAQIFKQRSKAEETYVENYKKKHGKHPPGVMLPRSLIVGFNRSSKRLQRVLALRRSELQFHEWYLKRLAELVGELSEQENAKPLAALSKGLSDRDWNVRTRCVRLVAHLRGAKAQALFTQAMEREKDPLVLAEMVRLRVRQGGADVFRLLSERLDDAAWPVRAAVVRELARIPRRESIDLLVARMQKEDGRLLDDIAAALRTLTGKNYLPEPDPWRIWWEKNRNSWKPLEKGGTGAEGEEARQDGVVYFYGIRSSSKRVVFCIDISGSMDFPLDGREGKKPPRIESARKELYSALAALPEDALFTIVVYNAEVRQWKQRLQPANLRNKQAARKFVEKLKPAGATNIFDALLTSMEVAATAGHVKGKDPEADTIFFLTDGVPTHGKVKDPHQILAEITRRNGLLGLVIHCVGVSKDQNRAFLMNLAERNGGRYVGHK